MSDLFDDDELDDMLQAIEEEGEDGGSTATVDGQGSVFSGLKGMTDEEIKQFHDSQEYREFKADIEEATDTPANMRGKTVQETMGLSNRREAVGYSYNALEHYEVDLEIYQDIVDQSPVMQQTLEEGEEVLPTFKYLHQDIFLSLYKYKAKVLPETSMHVSTRMNRGIISNLINTP